MKLKFENRSIQVLAEIPGLYIIRRFEKISLRIYEYKLFYVYNSLLVCVCVCVCVWCFFTWREFFHSYVDDLFKTILF